MKEVKKKPRKFFSLEALQGWALHYPLLVPLLLPLPLPLPLSLYFPLSLVVSLPLFPSLSIQGEREKEAKKVLKKRR